VKSLSGLSGEAFFTILLPFLGILFVVGVDVGMNTATPKFLMERVGLPLEQAGLCTSLYFAARTVAALTGAILLARLASTGFFRVSMISSIGAMILILVILGGMFYLLIAAYVVKPEET
jgi:FHS family L-fucose permease-like MFS transporter